MIIFETENGEEVLLTDGDIEEISLLYAWPYEWEVASRLREELQRLKEKLAHYEEHNKERQK